MAVVRNFQPPTCSDRIRSSHYALFRDIHVLQSLPHEILLDEPELKAYHPN